MCVRVCMCVCVCARLSNFQTTIIHKRLEISSWNLVQQWSSHARSIVLTPNLRFYGISNFLKNVCSSSNFRKIWVIILKLHKNIIHQSRTFGIVFGQNWLERSNFFKFWIFWKFFLICVACANFESLRSKFVYQCTNTKWCFIRSLVRIGRGL